MDAAVPGRLGTGLLQAPLVALEFLTVLRLRRPAVVGPEVLGSSQAFFPLVGLLLGGILAAADWALALEIGTGLRGWILVALLLALTGGLHADGLADSADGLFGGTTPARRLEVMRDAAIGAFGAAALIVVLAIKAAALGELLGSGAHPEALVLVPALSRWACVTSIAGFRYARPEGLGAAFHGASWPWPAPVAGLTCLAAAILGLGPEGAAAWSLAAGAGLALGAAINSRLGGLTGDSYGAVVEVSEAMLLVVAAAWAS